MRFSWFMVSWKPRELMFFADDLANLAKLPISDLPSAVKVALLKWASHLRVYQSTELNGQVSHKQLSRNLVCSLNLIICYLLFCSCAS